MKKVFFSVFFLVIFIACIFVSCKDEPDIKYHTPTAIGRITLDSGVSASLGDFFIQVSDTGAQFNTNSDGTWAVTGLESGKEYTLYFSNKPFGNNISRAVGDDVSYGARKDHVYGQAGNGRDNGTVVIRQNGAISGRITLNDSPDDHSGIDITIPGTSFATKTVADGTFRLSDIPEGTYVLKISKTGYETKTLDDVKVTIEGGDTITELPDMEIASGQGIVTGVVGFNGLISGNLIPATTVSLVSLTDNALIASVEASADTGEFTIYKVFPGTYKLQIQADGCQLYEESLEVKAGVTTTVGKKLLSLDGGTVTGVVKDIEGNPLKSAFIQVSSNEMPFRFTAQTSEDGRFSIQNCIPGENSIEISKLGYATETKKITVAEGSSTDIGDAKLYIESAILKGRCILSGESNNSGVVVSIKNTKTGNSFDAVTTEDGSFEIAGINVVGTYSISYSKTGFKSAVSSIDIAEFGKVFMAADMSLYSAYATIKGNVALYDGGSADGVAVLFELQDGTNSYDTTTNSSGDYIITKVLPGMYNMTISKAGYDSRTVLGIPVSESEYKVMDDVVLKAKTRTISGNVSLTGTSNHSGVAVTATNMNKPELVYSAITNSDGAYYMNNITAGRYIVTFSKDRYISPEAEVVDLTSALEAVVDAKTMSLAAGGVTGKVKANGLSDHSGIVVTLTYSTSPEIIRTTVTDSSGNYSFTDLLMEGSYFVTASREDYISSSPKTVNVKNGEVTEVEDILLLCNYSTINGNVTLYDGNSSEGINVLFESEDGSRRYDTVTNANGNYLFEKVLPGI